MGLEKKTEHCDNDEQVKFKCGQFGQGHIHISSSPPTILPYETPMTISMMGPDWKVKLCETPVTPIELYETIKTWKCFIKTHNNLLKVRRTDATYIKHLKALKHAKATIDNKAPNIFVDSILHSGKLVEDFIRNKEILRENMELVKRINFIKRTKGVIDTYNPVAGLRRTNLKQKLFAIDRYEEENISLINRIITKEPAIRNDLLEIDWQKNVKQIKTSSKYPIILPGLEDTGTDLIKGKYSLTSFLALSRPRIFIEFSVKNERPLGRLTLVLFYDIVPKTCQQFYDYCTNHKTTSSNENEQKSEVKAHVSYINTPVFHIFPNLYAEMGRYSFDSKEEYEKSILPEENFLIDHNYTGTVAMVKSPTGHITSEFSISFKPLSVMNGFRVVFGRVVHGEKTLKILENCGSKKGRPRDQIIISKTGAIASHSVGMVCLTKLC